MNCKHLVMCCKLGQNDPWCYELWQLETPIGIHLKSSLLENNVCQLSVVFSFSEWVLGCFPGLMTSIRI